MLTLTGVISVTHCSLPVEWRMLAPISPTA